LEKTTKKCVEVNDRKQIVFKHIYANPGTVDKHTPEYRRLHAQPSTKPFSCNTSVLHCPMFMHEMWRSGGLQRVCVCFDLERQQHQKETWSSTGSGVTDIVTGVQKALVPRIQLSCVPLEVSRSSCGGLCHRQHNSQHCTVEGPDLLHIYTML
jgi:hypothetical protein